MSFAVTIAGQEAPVRVATGETVLEAALAQGVPYPHGCRSGNCGACKSRLLDGDVELLPHSDYALTAEEEDSGLILACRAVPWSDASVEWLEVDEVILHPQRRLTCRVVRLDALSHDTKRLTLEIVAGGPFDFSPGQYAALRFAGLPLRDYSMANPPGEPVLEFFVRRLAGGTASAHVAERLRLGDTVHVEGPYGSSWLRQKHTGPIIAVAGGSGLAPVKSIVESALRDAMPQPIHLYFGVQDERDLYLEREFGALAAAHANFRFTAVLSAPGAATARRTGLLHEAVAADFADFDGCKAYVAGPPPMVEAAKALFTARGMRRQDIHADAFYNEADKAPFASGRAS